MKSVPKQQVKIIIGYIYGHIPVVLGFFFSVDYILATCTCSRESQKKICSWWLLSPFCAW